jgi:CheY-like chemotaxis protein
LDDIILLLVEDEPLIGMNLAESLREGGYSVHHAISGAEAVAMLETKEAAVSGIVTDVQLGPGPDGWDVARRARELIAHIPIIYMTGDSAGEHTAQGVPDSVMVQKPFAVVQIITAMSMLLNSVPPKA